MFLIYNAAMNATSLDAMMSPVAGCLDTPSLRALADLRASPEATERVQWLASRANEGLLTKEEHDEYESCVMFANFLGVLQSKARRKLNGAG
jgi:hypothetical protein